MMGYVWNENTTLLEWLMTWGQKDYEEAISWADDFCERQEKEKAAQESEALKAAKAQEAEALKAAKAKKLQRLADNLIEDEMDAHAKVSDVESTTTGGPEDADEIQDKIEDLELTLKKLQKAAIELETQLTKKMRHCTGRPELLDEKLKRRYWRL
jgi:hypothetical protein